LTTFTDHRQRVADRRRRDGRFASTAAARKWQLGLTGRVSRLQLAQTLHDQ